MSAESHNLGSECRVRRTFLRVFHVADDVSDSDQPDGSAAMRTGPPRSPHLTLSQDVNGHFLGVVDPHFEDVVPSIRLEESDFVALLQRSGEDPHKGHDPSELVVAGTSERVVS